MFGTKVCYCLILSVQIRISTMLFFWTFYSLKQTDKNKISTKNIYFVFTFL